MCCRVLLMHIAVSKKAESGKAFAFYIDFLDEKNFIPQESKDWVKQIKDIGNKANHELAPISKAEAEEVLEFTGMLLKLVYEYPARLRRHQSKEK